MGGSESIGFGGPLGAALSTVRSELRAAFVVGVVGFLATFYALRIWVWPALERELLGTDAVVVAVTPFDVVLLQAKLGLVGGLLLAGGFVAYRSRDRLRARGVVLPGSRRTRLLVAVLAVALFVGGVAYAYALFLPLLFDFLVSNAIAAGFRPTYSVVDWTQFVLLLTLVLGLTAELPLLMAGAVYADLIRYETLRNRWRHAVFAIVVVSSMVNGSPDPFSMSLVAVPMTVLYFVGLGCARVVPTAGPNRADHGSPDEVRIEDLDSAGVLAAPPEAFAALTEHEVLALADDAMDAGDVEKAVAILDRFDEHGGAGDGTTNAGESNGGSAASERSLSSTVERTAVGMADAFTEDGTEDDIGGYYYDLRFVLDSLASKSFRIVGAFALVVGATFTLLYSGGIGAVKRDFLGELPSAARASAADIVLLHPVEALAFEMKVSLIVGAVAVLPLVLYYAWPAIEERRFGRGNTGRGDRDVFLVWAAVLGAGLLAGSAVGYRYVAPAVVSYLVWDALAADMVVAYRVAAFFWLVFATTVGVGLLFEVPLTMALFHHGGIVSYRTMRTRWREFVVGVLVLASLLPGGVLLMLLVGCAVGVAYGVGLTLLWVESLGARLVRTTA